MQLDWNDFSADSGVEDTPLLISIRTQSLLLTALSRIQRRYHWLDVSDATWDDIDGAIAQAAYEVMEANILGTLGGCSVYSSANQNIGAPTNTWHPIQMNEAYYDTDNYRHGASVTSYLEIPANGTYLITAHALFNANSSVETFLRQSRILINGAQVSSFMDGSIVSRSTPHIHSIIKQLVSTDIVSLECLTTIPNLLLIASGSYTPMLTIERLR